MSLAYAHMMSLHPKIEFFNFFLKNPKIELGVYYGDHSRNSQSITISNKFKFL